MCDSEWINMSKLALIHQNNQSTFSVAGFFDLLDYAESDQFAARVDALQDGVFDILDRTKDSIAHPWVGAIKTLGTIY